MKRLAILALLLAVVLLVFAGCGGGGATSDSGGNETGGSGIGPVNEAEAATCAANRRMISAAASQYGATEGSNPTSIQQLLPQYLQSLPVCPAGGTYSLSGTTVTCSVHGK